MRLGLLSDVHANLEALEAVLSWLDRRGVDQVLCPGDLVGYGPSPGACVAQVLARPDVLAVAGNHDLIVRGELTTARCSASARAALAWTARQPGLAPLAALPRTARAGEVALAHGSWTDPERYVRSLDDVRDALAEVDARVLVVGHTHVPLVATADRVLLQARAGRVALPRDAQVLVNPGAVGQTRFGPPRARAAVLDLDRGEVELGAVRYDLRATRRRLRAAGLPADSVHVREPAKAWVKRALLRRG